VESTAVIGGRSPWLAGTVDGVGAEAQLASDHVVNQLIVTYHPVKRGTIDRLRLL